MVNNLESFDYLHAEWLKSDTQFFTDWLINRGFIKSEALEIAAAMGYKGVK